MNKTHYLIAVILFALFCSACQSLTAKSSRCAAGHPSVALHTLTRAKIESSYLLIELASTQGSLESALHLYAPPIIVIQGEKTEKIVHGEDLTIVIDGRQMTEKKIIILSVSVKSSKWSARYKLPQGIKPDKVMLADAIAEGCAITVR